MTPALGILQREARRFGVCERADEVLNPGVDQRQRKLAQAQKRAELVATGGNSGAAETAEVMPRGRNFH